MERLATFPNNDDCSSGHDYHRSNYHRIDEHLQNLVLDQGHISEEWMIDHITTLETMIGLPVLLVEMILINFQGCIQMDIQILEHELVIMDHLNQHIQVMDNSFNHILTT